MEKGSMKNLGERRGRFKARHSLIINCDEQITKKKGSSFQPVRRGKGRLLYENPSRVFYGG
jgi:hypothetical protein